MWKAREGECLLDGNINTADALPIHPSRLRRTPFGGTPVLAGVAARTEVRPGRALLENANRHAMQR